MAETYDSSHDDPEYPGIPEREIAEVAGYDPLRAHLMMMANQVSEDAREQRLWAPREQKQHNYGWEMVLHDGTKKSAVGLWSCWLGNELYLGYPKDLYVPDDAVMNLLGVEYAKAVPNVSGCAVNDLDYKGELKDLDKPLESNSVGQIIAYQDRGPRLWAKFWGPVEERGGRVWIDQAEFHSNSYHMAMIDEWAGLERRSFGHNQSMSVSTFPFSFFSQYSPESPTANPEAIQNYKEGFIKLLVDTALRNKKPSKLTINYHHLMLPEHLEREGYENIRWLRGSPGERRGLGSELVSGRKLGEIVMLESGNSLVPWSIIRQLDVPEERANTEGLYDFITEALYF